MPSTQGMKASLSDLSPSLQAHWTSHLSSWGLGRIWDKALHRKWILRETLGKGILSLRLMQSKPSLIFQERQNEIEYHSSENFPQSLLTAHLYIPSITAFGPCTNAQRAFHRCKQHPRASPATESPAGHFLPAYCRSNQRSGMEMWNCLTTWKKPVLICCWLHPILPLCTVKMLLPDSTCFLTSQKTQTESADWNIFPVFSTESVSQKIQWDKLETKRKTP